MFMDQFVVFQDADQIARRWTRLASSTDVCHIGVIDRLRSTWVEYGGSDRVASRDK